MTNETRRLAEFAVSTGYQDLPPSVVDRCKVYLLDALAAALVGSRLPWCRIVADTVQEMGAAPQCSMPGLAWKTAPSLAALVNGTTIGGYEMDHAFLAGSAHPGSAVVPAALAIGELRHESGQSLLRAIAVGYEALCRIGYAATRAVEDERGFHGPGTNAPFGSAIAAGLLLGLTADRMVQAIGIAASHGGGILEFIAEGAMTKRLHVGRGAQLGLESALLASRGFVGPLQGLEGKHGFLAVYSPAPETKRLTAGLGKEWLLEQMLVKRYPTHGQFQGVIEAILGWKARNPRRTGQVRGIAITGPKALSEERFNNPAPASVLGAQYSLQCSVGVALCRDIESDAMVFDDQALANPEIARIARAVRVAGESSDGSVSIAIETDAGHEEVSLRSFKGAPGNPFTFDELLQAKFMPAAIPVLGEARARAAGDMVRRLEDLRDVGELARLFSL